MKKAVLALSGGMDSTTLLSHLLNKRYEVHPFQFIYGSKHNWEEVEAVRQISKYFGIRVPIIDLTKVFKNISSSLLLTGDEIPEGHYSNSNMSKTVVPGRNSIFISILVGIAESIEADRVVIGVHSGDHHIYPDCRKNYIYAMRDAMLLASDSKVRLWAPFLHLDKTSIIQIGLDLKTPYHLTRTCYKYQPIACGRCGSCQERLEAFKANGIDDPIEYESRELMEKE